MKNMKNTFRIVFCLILTLTMVLSLASCDLKGAFKSLGEGDFKGAWNAIIGKDTHEHNYTAVVTAPDCVTEGYTTYTCECGHTYVGDNVAALGHDYKEKVTRFPTTLTNGVISKICMRCGVHTDKSLEAVSFELPVVSEFLRSIVGRNVLEVNAEDMQYIHIKEIFTYDTQSTTYDHEYLALHLGQIEINGEGDELYAYINLNLGVVRYSGPEASITPTFDETTKIIVIVNGEDVFVSIDEDGYGEANFTLSRLFYDAVASSYGMTYEQFVEAVYVSGKTSALIPVFEGMLEGLADIVIPEGASFEEILNLIADEIVVVDGNVYKIDFNGLAELLDTVQNKTVGEIVDEQYGAGTVDRLEDFIVSLPTAKLRDIADAALKFSDKCGVALDDVYALINYAVYTASGVDFNIEAEIITRYNKTLVEVIVEISGQEDADVAEITETLTTNLSRVVEEVKSVKLADIFGDIGSAAPYTGATSSDENIVVEFTVADDGSVEQVYIYVEGMLTVSAGYDEEGYSATVKYYDMVTYSLDVNEFDATFTLTYEDDELYRAYLTFNEAGEILTCDIVTKQMYWIGGGYVDEFGNEIYEEELVITDGYTVEYVNNGDGTHTLSVKEDGYSEWNAEATVTETEEALTVNGSYTITYFADFEFGADTVVNGTFAGNFPYDYAAAASFELKTYETVYDFTCEYDEFGCEINRTYDFENPHVYQILDLQYAYDGNGKQTLDLESGYVYHDAGTSTLVKDNDLHVAITETEDTLSMTATFAEDGDEISISANYAINEYTVYAEEPTTYYYLVLESLNVTYFDMGLEFDITYTMTETEQGAKFSLDINGFRYYEYSSEYIPSTSVEYDGSDVTIVFYHTMGSSAREVLDAYIAEFNEQYPNITIEHYQVGGYDDLRDQIQSELMYGMSPNIAYCYSDHVAIYNMMGAAVPLDSFINDNKCGFTEYELNDFIDGFYAEGQMFDEEGTTYMLPMSKSTELLYYNKTFFDEHNLTVPTTWDEMEEVCRQIKEIDPNCIPLAYDSEANWFITMCEQLGTPYTSATGEHFLFDTPENQEFVKRFREWYQNGWVTTQEILGCYSSDIFTNVDSYGTRCYMSIGSSAGARYQLPEAGADGWPAFVVGITSVPQVDPENPKAISQGPSICMFESDPQEMAASWLFMKFLTTNVDFQADFSMTTGYMPVIESVQYDYEYLSFLNNAYPTSSGITALAIKTALAQTDAYFASPAFFGSSAARDEVGILLQVCFLTPTSNVEAMIDEAFKNAVAECKYRVGE